jgi:acyl-coenzyme A thioesterase PaaI-like protein
MLEVMERMVRGEVPPPPIGKLLGMRLVEVTEGEARFELEADELARATSTCMVLRGEKAQGR